MKTNPWLLWDLCTDCSDPFPLGELSAHGRRCTHCDPEGFLMEGPATNNLLENLDEPAASPAYVM